MNNYNVCRVLQHLMSGWLFKYNLKCQSIDYNENDQSRRVSFLLELIRYEGMAVIHCLVMFWEFITQLNVILEL